MAGSVALWSGEPKRTQIATANGASGRATPARSASTDRKYGEISWRCPLKQVVKGDIVPGFQGAGITRTLQVHDPPATIPVSPVKPGATSRQQAAGSQRLGGPRFVTPRVAKLPSWRTTLTAFRLHPSATEARVSAWGLSGTSPVLS